MKRFLGKRMIAATVGAVLLVVSVPHLGSSAANVQETPDLQLQTIKIDNDGADWTTLSWGGATMTPNTNWTTLNIQDYYANGTLDFEVRNNGTGDTTFRMGLMSKRHGEIARICWTDLEQYGLFKASSEWTTYSLSIKELVDAYPNSGFRLDSFWYVYAGGVPNNTTISFRNMVIRSTDDERQYPMIKVNQVGYLCNAKKTARISYFEKFGSLDGKSYQIVRADTDEVVATGVLPHAEKDALLSGEYVHVIQFDELTTPGTY